jgi:hypothetical protein
LLAASGSGFDTTLVTVGTTTALAATADAGAENQARRFVVGTHSHFGRLDVLVNNAGVMRLGPADVGQARPGCHGHLQPDQVRRDRLLRVAAPGVRRPRHPRHADRARAGGGPATRQGPLAERFSGAPVIAAGGIARAIVSTITQPDNVDISELVIRPAAAAS